MQSSGVSGPNSAISNKGVPTCQEKRNNQTISRSSGRLSQVRTSLLSAFVQIEKFVEIEYKGGGADQYYGCDQALFDNLLKAESVGKFVHVKLKPKRFTKI